MTKAIDRRVLLRSAANFRDLGGLQVDGGTVAKGRVFRSATLSRLSDDELPAFEGLGIEAVYDLRTVEESTADPDRLPATARLVGLDLLADGGGSGVAQAVGRLRERLIV